jgi:hypothetical protein
MAAAQQTPGRRIWHRTCRIGGACRRTADGRKGWIVRALRGHCVCSAHARPMLCADHSPRLGERCRTVVRHEQKVDRCHWLPPGWGPDLAQACRIGGACRRTADGRKGRIVRALRGLGPCSTYALRGPQSALGRAVPDCGPARAISVWSGTRNRRSSRAQQVSVVLP